jgi:hypothetical protein
MPGHVYILKNPYIPKLVKIGFTERDPETRAYELSTHTGVPGEFQIVHSWLVAEPSLVEAIVHLDLKAYRRTGEFFELSPQNARSLVERVLLKAGAIGPDGLSFDARSLASHELAKEEHRSNEIQHATDVADLKDSMESIAHVIATEEWVASHQQLHIHADTGVKYFFKNWGRIHTPEQEVAITKAISLVMASISNKLIKLGLPSLLHPLEKAVTLQDDIYFWGPSLARTEDCLENRKVRSLQRIEEMYLPISPPAMWLYQKGASVPLHHYLPLDKPYDRHLSGVLLRMPKATTIEGSKGWQFNRKEHLLINDSLGIRVAKKGSNRFGLFSPRGGYGNHSGNTKTFMNRQSYSQKKNLGAYDCDNLRIIWGELSEID